MTALIRAGASAQGPARPVLLALFAGAGQFEASLNILKLVAGNEVVKVPDSRRNFHHDLAKDGRGFAERFITFATQHNRREHKRRNDLREFIAERRRDNDSEGRSVFPLCQNSPDTRR